MEKTRFGSTDLIVSKVAMGGIPIMRLDKEGAVKVIRNVLDMGVNFIDTANAYGDSEEKIGEALKRYKREDIVLATKSAARDKKTFLEHIDLSLRRLETDYIDIYQMHNISDNDIFEQVMAPGGAFQGLEEAVAKGKVRYYAFSSHNVPTAEKLVRTGKFHSTQVPLNFIDTEAEKLIPIAREKGLGFIAMKPMGGGLLDDASLAFKYLGQFEGVFPDPGIEKTGEMEQILGIMEDLSPLSKKERDRIKEIKEETGDNWCHRCGYCLPCPQEINIPMSLIVSSTIKRVGYEGALRWAKPNIEGAKACTECGECMDRCPYDLNIPELIKKNINVYEDYIKSHSGP